MSENTPIVQVPKHPLEAMNGMAERVTLPGSGIEVVIRRADVELLTADAARFMLKTSELQAVSQEWAKEAGEFSKVAGQIDRPQTPLDMAQQIDLTLKTNVGLLRSVVVAPKLDDLIEVYGGSEEQADVGLGPDYRFLMDAVNRLNPAKDKEQDKSPSEAVPAPARRNSKQPR